MTLRDVKRWQVLVAAAMATLGLIAALRPIVFALVFWVAGAERAVAHAEDVGWLQTQIDSVRADVTDTRQWTACLLWDVSPEDCDRFRIPRGPR